MFTPFEGHWRAYVERTTRAEEVRDLISRRRGLIFVRQDDWPSK